MGVGERGEGRSSLPFPLFRAFLPPPLHPLFAPATQASPLIKTSVLRSTLLQTFLLKVELLCRISRISHRSSVIYLELNGQKTLCLNARPSGALENHTQFRAITEKIYNVTHFQTQTTQKPYPSNSGRHIYITEHPYPLTYPPSSE